MTNSLEQLLNKKYYPVKFTVLKPKHVGDYFEIRASTQIVGKFTGIEPCKSRQELNISFSLMYVPVIPMTINKEISQRIQTILKAMVPIKYRRYKK